MRRKLGPSRRRVVLDDEAAKPERYAVAPAASGSRRPLVAALVPDPDVWRVSGSGRTLCARRRADGRVSWASIVFDLKRPASITFFGSEECDEGPFEEILDALYRIEDAPPMIGGSASLAERFAHGALAVARAADPKLAPPDATILSVFGEPRGSDEQLVKALLGEDGVCARELVNACAQEAAEDLGEGEALAVHVAMAFRALEPSELARALAGDPDFSPLTKGQLAWKPARAAGKKLGSVYLDGDSLEAETVSLDLAGHLCARLKRLAQGGLELTKVRHTPL